MLKERYSDEEINDSSKKQTLKPAPPKVKDISDHFNDAGDDITNFVKELIKGENEEVDITDIQEASFNIDPDKITKEGMRFTAYEAEADKELIIEDILENAGIIMLPLIQGDATEEAAAEILKIIEKESQDHGLDIKNVLSRVLDGFKVKNPTELAEKVLYNKDRDSIEVLSEVMTNKLNHPYE